MSNQLYRLRFDLKLDTYPVRGRLRLQPTLPGVRAILEIPEQGPLREAFRAHLSGVSCKPYMILGWSLVEYDHDLPTVYETRGKIVNTQFSSTRWAIFQAEAWTEQLPTF